MTGIVIVLFVVACVLPSFRLGGGEYQPGIVGLLCGWIACACWLPNPLLYFGCRGLVCGHFRYACVMGVVACCCTLPIIYFFDVRENLSWGYYVWQGDIVFFTVMSGVLWNWYGESVGERRRR